VGNVDAKYLVADAERRLVPRQPFFSLRMGEANAAEMIEDAVGHEEPDRAGRHRLHYT
jgi:hypothetical protein